jgi:hypothetical protein
MANVVKDLASPLRLLRFLDAGKALRESPVVDAGMALFERGYKLTICPLPTMR